MLPKLIVVVASSFLAAAAVASPQTMPFHVSVVGSTSPTLSLAGKDAVRYLRLLRCGHGPSSAACVSLSASPRPPGSPTLLIATLDTLSHAQLASLDDALVFNLTGDAHLVAPLGGNVTLCTGATPRAALYAVYTLLEALGVRFYITGDVLPQPNPLLSFPASPILSTPLFAERGLQPFHDFPMGCVLLLRYLGALLLQWGAFCGSPALLFDLNSLLLRTIPHPLGVDQIGGRSIFTK
jgi:hypothetical protein